MNEEIISMNEEIIGMKTYVKEAINAMNFCFVIQSIHLTSIAKVQS